MIQWVGVKELVVVGLGGFLGSVARYKLGGLVLHHTVNSRYPYGTFAVNILGCLLIGLIAGFIERYHVFGAEMRLLLLTGILGGFTTFSAFGLDTVFLIRRGDFLAASIYVVTTVFCGVLAVWVCSKVTSFY